jgi:hypothetical protein
MRNSSCLDNGSILCIEPLPTTKEARGPAPEGGRYNYKARTGCSFAILERRVVIVERNGAGAFMLGLTLGLA